MVGGSYDRLSSESTRQEDHYRVTWKERAPRERGARRSVCAYCPCPTNCQLVSAIVGRNADVDTASPFISHTMFWPVTLLRQITSALPSASKSPTPWISQFVSAIVGRNAELDTVSPFMSHPMFWPLTLLRQITSALPSP